MICAAIYKCVCDVVYSFSQSYLNLKLSSATNTMDMNTNI